MQFNAAQQAVFKAWLDVNAAGLSDDQAAALANSLATPNYWVWRTSVSRVDIYRTASDLPSNWVWSTYKSQTATEQGAWTQMFMGDACDMSALNNRVGVDDIFGGAAPGNAQRSHIFAVSRRRCNNVERLFVVAAPTASGKVTGNDGVAGNRGLTTNPDLLVLEGLVTPTQIAEVRASG